VFLIDSPRAGSALNDLILPKTETHLLVVARIGKTLLGSMKTLAAQLAMLPTAESFLIINDVSERTLAANVTSSAPQAGAQAVAMAPQQLASGNVQISEAAEAAEASW